MPELVEIDNNTLPAPKVWNGQRVVTFKDIDTVHKLKAGNARRNFSRNKKHFVEHEEFEVITREKANGTFCPFENIPPKGITVLTEMGYLMLAKSFTDDLSWKVQRQLINGYFKPKTSEVETKLYPLLSDNGDWYKSHDNHFKYLCDKMKIDKKTLFHKILVNISDDYDIDKYKIIYERETGKPHKYIMQVVEHFQELRECADVEIEILLRSFRNREMRDAGKKF